MANETAADRMKVACDAIMRGDFMAAMSDLSPQAMAEAMQLAGGFTGVPMPDSYTIDSEDVSGEEHRFHVTFRGSGQQLGASVSWQVLGGIWMIVGMKLDGTA
jgi:hypothetical protein